jgi:hypothetical protein
MNNEQFDNNVKKKLLSIKEPKVTNKQVESVLSAMGNQTPWYNGSISIKLTSLLGTLGIFGITIMIYFLQKDNTAAVNNTILMEEPTSIAKKSNADYYNSSNENEKITANLSKTLNNESQKLEHKNIIINTTTNNQIVGNNLSGKFEIKDNLISEGSLSRTEERKININKTTSPLKEVSLYSSHNNKIDKSKNEEDKTTENQKILVQENKLDESNVSNDLLQLSPRQIGLLSYDLFSDISPLPVQVTPIKIRVNKDNQKFSIGPGGLIGDKRNEFGLYIRYNYWKGISINTGVKLRNEFDNKFIDEASFTKTEGIAFKKLYTNKISSTEVINSIKVEKHIIEVPINLEYQNNYFKYFDLVTGIGLSYISKNKHEVEYLNSLNREEEFETQVDYKKIDNYQFTLGLAKELGKWNLQILPTFNLNAKEVDIRKHHSLNNLSIQTRLFYKIF